MSSPVDAILHLSGTEQNMLWCVKLSGAQIAGLNVELLSIWSYLRWILPEEFAV